MQGSPTERVACYRGEFRGEYEFPDNPPLCPAILAWRRAPLLLSGLSHVEASTAFLLRLTVVAVLSGASVGGPHTPGRAEESYPWCVQGENLQCHYQTREQCEFTANYHGFCIANLSALPQTYSPLGGGALPDKLIRAENRNLVAAHRA